MQYDKREDGSYARLRQHNVDTGMGVERTITMLQGRDNVYETELFAPAMEAIASASGRHRDADAETTRAFRVIADHMRSAIFILGDPQGIVPGNLGQGYVLRRLIRRTVRYARRLGMQGDFTTPLAERVVAGYQDVYPELRRNHDTIVR